MSTGSIETADIGRRSRRDGSRRAAPGAARAIPQLPRRQIVRRFPPTEIVSADEIEAIHNASLSVLEDIGMDFTHPDARALLKSAGASIEGDRVRFDRAMIEELMRSVPKSFTF